MLIEEPRASFLKTPPPGSVCLQAAVLQWGGGGEEISELLQHGFLKLYSHDRTGDI